MAGLPIYHCSKDLAGCWWIPVERIGCDVERFLDRGVIRRASAKVGIGFDEGGFILVFSALLTRRGKNSQLAAEVERILLASGAKVYGKPISTNLVYQVRELPDYSWLESLNPEKVKIVYAPHTGDDGSKRDYPCGCFKVGTESIRFWTGPAIDSATKALIHYIALAADAVRLGVAPADSFLNSIDLALIGNGARRIEVQRKLDK
jgi:hypothetical protein